MDNVQNSEKVTHWIGAVSKQSCFAFHVEFKFKFSALCRRCYASLLSENPCGDVSVHPASVLDGMTHQHVICRALGKIK